MLLSEGILLNFPLFFVCYCFRRAIVLNGAQFSVIFIFPPCQTLTESLLEFERVSESI